ncbi:MAG: stage V sporulation protein AD, partial [Acutalibacteraceae bacterium]|nr:stage V sporulation protein AD [Acutalibacteraceae bacterium]
MRQGRYTIEFENKPSVVEWSAVAGQKESEGPLGNLFDMIISDATDGKDTWEQAESELQKTAIGILLDKAGVKDEDVNVIFAGDLLN